MRKRLLPSLFLASLFCCFALAQNISGVAPVTGTINASGATCAALVMDSTNSGPSNCVSEQLPSTASTASVVLAGTFSATVQFELSADSGRTWIAAPVAFSTAAGTTTFSVSGYNGVRARASAYSSGSAAVTITVGVGNAGSVTLLQISGVPSGPCTSGMATNTLTNDLYVCPSGVWTKLGAGIRNALANGGSTGSASVDLLTLPTWAAGTFYNGTTGASGHADWILSTCTADATNKQYVWENIAGDIPVASVNPAGAGTCTAGSTIADGNGTWSLIALGGFPVTVLGVATNVMTVTSSATNLNVAPNLTNNAKVIIAGCTEAANLFANTGIGYSGTAVAPSFTVNSASQTSTTFTANYTTTGTGAASSSCKAYVASGYGTNGVNGTSFMQDEYAHKILPYISGHKVQLAANVFDSGTYNGTQAPTFASWTAADAVVNQNSILTDPQWKAGIQPKTILFSVSHAQDSGGTIGNTQTPTYIPTVAYADSIKNPWTASTKYLFGQYIFNAATSHYYQMVANGATSPAANAGVCASNAAGAAPSHTNGTNVAEAAGSLNLPQCIWKDFGVHAPPQDYLTCASNLGNSAMQQLALGIYNMNSAGLNATCTLGQGASGHCNEADLSTAMPAWWETPYQTAVAAEDTAVINRYGSNALGWGPKVLSSIQFGELEVGQSYPYCAAFIQGASVLNLPNAGTAAGIPNWDTFHTTSLHPFYYARSKAATAMGLPPFFVGASPQSNNTATDVADSTLLADAEAADLSGPATAPSGLADPNYFGGLNMAQGFDGLQASDVAVIPNHLHGDMAFNAGAWCNLSRSCYTEQTSPGTYDGSNNAGRLDYNMRFSQAMKIKNFGMYATDFWCIDPNSVLYNNCGQSYLAAIQAFETDSAVQALTFQGQYIDQVVNTSAATGSITATTAQMGAPNFIEATFNLTGTMTANQTITLPGVSALFQAQNPLQATVTNFSGNGTTYKLRIMNSSAGNFTRTIQANTAPSGWTLVGNMVIPAGYWEDFYINFTSGNTATMTAVGFGTNGGGAINTPLGSTNQKAETTTADANVLTVTPPAIIGTYRACVSISVSAATAGVIGWTLSWTDSSGNAQSNIAQPLFQYGTAAPALTFTTSAAGNYGSCSPIDINNAAAAIVVKWVGGGTTTAKMSATIERLL